MDSAVLGFVGALVGTTVGAAASVGTTILTQRQQRRQEEQASSQQRRRDAINFQGESLLGLQQATNEYVNACAAGDAHNKALRQHNVERGEAHIPPDLLAAMRQATGQVLLFMERIQDKRVRDEVEYLLMLGTQAVTSPDWEEAEQSEIEFTATWMSVHRHIGEALRGFFDPITLPAASSSPFSPADSSP